MFRYETEHVYLSVYACYHHRESIVDMEIYVCACVCDVLHHYTISCNEPFYR